MFLRTATEDLVKNEKRYFESTSDKLLKPLSSLDVKKYVSLTSEVYDKSYLKNLTNTDTDEQIAGAAAGEEADDLEEREDPAEIQRQAEEEQSVMKLKDNKAETVLEKIFKSLGVGSNLIERGRSLVRGLKKTSNGIVNLIKNIAIMTAITGIDTISFVGSIFASIFRMCLLSIKRIQNCPKCIGFYLFDITLFLTFVFMVSPLFIIDSLFFVKSFAGIGLVESLFIGLNKIAAMDKTIHSLTGIHITRYPRFIQNLCYDTDELGDSSENTSAYSRLIKDLFVDFPAKISGPISEISTGAINIRNFFKPKK